MLLPTSKPTPTPTPTPTPATLTSTNANAKTHANNKFQHGCKCHHQCHITMPTPRLTTLPTPSRTSTLTQKLYKHRAIINNNASRSTNDNTHINIKTQNEWIIKDISNRSSPSIPSSSESPSKSNEDSGVPFQIENVLTLENTKYPSRSICTRE